MLSKGLRDEKKEEINKAFNALLTWEYIPQEWQKQDREKYSLYLKQQLDYSLNELISAEKRDLKDKLIQKHFDFDLYLKLGEVLEQIIDLETAENRAVLAEKIIFIYQVAQDESKTFSFELVQKIKATKKYLTLS